MRTSLLLLSLLLTAGAVGAYTFAGDEALITCYGTAYSAGGLTMSWPVEQVAEPASVTQTSATQIVVPISTPLFQSLVPGTVSGNRVVLHDYLPGPIGPLYLSGVLVRLNGITVHFEGDVTQVNPTGVGAYGPVVDEVTGVASPTSYITIEEYEVKPFGYWMTAGNMWVDISAWNVRRAIPVGATKFLPDGSGVSFSQALVTAALRSSSWIESDDRCAGIRVDSSVGLVPSVRSSCEGILQTDATGERYILGHVVQGTEVVDTNVPLGLTNKALGGGTLGYQQGVSGGSGLNNIGLLVRAWGTVTEIDPATPATWFKIDDGSGVGVKVLVPSTVTIDPAWNFVGVTGISSCEKVDGLTNRVIKLTRPSDILPL